MKKIELEELKKIELEVLCEIHKICQEQGIRYSLAEGTLIGAVRHKGFIPWDDDIDIFMPRPDYDRFIEYCRTNEAPFDIICAETNDKYKYLFAKAMAKNTIIIEEYSNSDDIEMGIYVDIFPVDGLADTYEGAKKEFSKTSFKRELLVAKNWTKYQRSKTRSWIYEPIRFAFFVLSRFVSAKKLIKSLNKRLKRNSFEEKAYSACVMSAYRQKEIMEADIFKEYVDVEFEGKTFKMFKNYHSCLSNIYGNYMELPPEEKRISRHSFEAYHKEIDN